MEVWQMFRYAYFFKSTFFMVMLVLFTACGGGAIETSDAQKSLATIANYSQDTSKIPTVEDYHNIGIAVTTPQNLDDINFLIRSLTYDEVNTESEILELVRRRKEALSLITAYASSHGNSAAPTVDTYRAIGVIGVNSENINAINALIAALQSEAVDTGMEVDAIVRGDTGLIKESDIPDQTSQDGSSINLNVSGHFNDPDGGRLRFSATGLPAGLALRRNTGIISGSLSHDASQSSPYTITITVSDSSSATVSDSFVWRVNNPVPIANDDIVAIVANISTEINVLANDRDPDGDSLSVIALSSPINGTAVLNASGTITYTPNAGYHGIDSFIYTLSDGEGGEDNAAVSVDVDSVAASMIKGLDDDNPVSYWTRSAGMKKPTLTASYDHVDKTEGTASLHLQAHIDGLSDVTKKWYYYLKIPISPALNVEGKLAFMVDVMVDENTAGHVHLGVNKQYYPISIGSGVKIFPAVNQSNQWVLVENHDLSAAIRDDLGWTARRTMYDGHGSDMGATIDRIGIYIFGKGPLDLDMHLDNLRLEGTQLKPSTFDIQVHQRWKDYIARVKRDLDDRNSSYTSMSSEINTTGETLCTKQQNLSDTLDADKVEIERLLESMYDTNANNTYFPQAKMDDLDSNMSDYEMAYTRLLGSLDDGFSVGIYRFPAMEYRRLNAYDIPKLKKATSYAVRMTRGEYRSIAMLLDPICAKGAGYTVENTAFEGSTHSLSAAIMDTYIAKIWYQAGLDFTSRTGKYAIQELLLKDENLVQVDFVNKINALRVTDNDTNGTHYIDITAADAPFPDTRTITVADAPTLKPFVLDEMRYKLIWSIIHIPDDATEGNYTATFSLKNESDEIVGQVPISIEVLPFELNASRLTYSLYYTGKLVSSPAPLKARGKSQAQQLIELRDMKEHGVLYPTSYESQSQLANTLTLRNSIGLPTDRFYSLGIGPFTGSTTLTTDVESYRSVLADKGYNPNELYCYAMDEAGEEQLEAEKKDIDEIHAAGAKVFVAGYNYTHDHLGEYLDLFNYAHGTIKSDSLEQVQLWHDSGKKIFTYAAPQVGVENPEVYRRNFGCKLWKQGYDGAMDWAYQYERGAFWNDFDGNSMYREETFTYPTTNGIVGTVEWEGYRDAITDVRYISTLLDIRDAREEAGEDMTLLNSFIQGIDCDGDLYKLREEIIDQINRYRY
jgi:hypothetical protein